MKYLLITIFSFVLIVACVKSDTTKIEIASGIEVEIEPTSNTTLRWKTKAQNQI
jgi:hypothetical protein